MNCTHLQVPERFGDKEPADVGSEIGKSVGPAPWVDWQHLGGNNPCQAAQSQVEGNSEAKDEGEGQPRDLKLNWKLKLKNLNEDLIEIE